MPRHSRPMLKYYYNSDMDRQIDQNFENACNSGCNCDNCPYKMRAGVCPYCKHRYMNCVCRRQKKGMYCFMIFMLLLIFFSILYLHPAKN
jgi:hypothetical protein